MFGRTYFQDLKKEIRGYLQVFAYYLQKLLIFIYYFNQVQIPAQGDNNYFQDLDFNFYFRSIHNFVLWFQVNEIRFLHFINDHSSNSLVYS